MFGESNVFVLLDTFVLPDLTHLIVQYLRGLTISMLTDWPNEVNRYGDDEKKTPTDLYYSPFVLQPRDLDALFDRFFPPWLLGSEPLAQSQVEKMKPMFEQNCPRKTLLHLSIYFFLSRDDREQKNFFMCWIKIWRLCDLNSHTIRESLIWRTLVLLFMMRLRPHSLYKLVTLLAINGVVPLTALGSNNDSIIEYLRFYCDRLHIYSYPYVIVEPEDHLEYFRVEALFSEPYRNFYLPSRSTTCAKAAKEDIFTMHKNWNQSICDYLGKRYLNVIDEVLNMMQTIC